MYQWLGTFITTAFAGALAFATAETTDDVVFLDIAENLQCDVEFGRQISKVVLGEFVSFESRMVQLIRSEGDVVSMQAASCAFEENLYICRWGRTNSITIDISNTSVSEVTAKHRHFMHGYAKLDVFRPSASVSCPLGSNVKN